jgi:diguanylate cyclase (GGDEF)-like protein
MKKVELSIYASSISFIALANYTTYQEIVSDYLIKKREDIQAQYNTITRDLKSKSNIYFNEVINKPEILSVFADSENINKTDLTREKLSELLNEPFKRMSLNDVRQLHFHTRDNKSFLRMHKKNKYGDYIGDVRYSVEVTNKNLKSYHGFEEGKVFGGFRNVYPVFFNEKHIGSVEISFSLKSVEIEFQQTLGGEYGFIVLKNVIDKSVFDINDHYVNFTINNKFIIEKDDNLDFLDNLSKNTVTQISANLSEMESFTIIIDDSKIINFLSIKNICGDKIGYLVNFINDEFLQTEQNNYFLFTIILIMIAFIIIYYIFHIIKKQEHIFIENLFDTNNNLVLMIKNNKLFNINKKFLDFIGITSLTDLANNLSIYDFFIAEYNYLSINNEETKDSVLIKLIETQNKIKMLEQETGKVKIFETSTISFNNQEIILIIFNEIINNIKMVDETKEHLFRDKLTGIFTKNKFENDLKILLHKNKTLSIILFNIDNFNHINKYYGEMIGDRILIGLTILIDSQIRKSDTLYKYSDIDFVILTNENMLGATKLAEKLRMILDKHKFFKEATLTMSFGVTEYRKLENSEEFLARGEKCLQTAKLSGKNCVVTN